MRGPRERACKGVWGTKATGLRASGASEPTRAERGMRGPRERAGKGVWGTKSPSKKWTR
jgi:hypothetical protein